MDTAYIIAGITLVVGLIGWLATWIFRKTWSELDNHRTRIHKLEQSNAAAELALRLLEMLRRKK